MDTITQAALGACIGQAGFSHKLGRRAMLFGAVCGTIPDLDVVTGAAGPFASLLYHRHLTHSLLVLPVLALVVGWLGHRLGGRDDPDDPRGTRREWTHLAFWALITHPLLDLFTTYGTQLLAPLSNQRFAIDGIAIIDPLYTLPILAVLVVSVVRGRRGKRFPKLVDGSRSCELERERVARLATTRVAAISVLLATTGYLFLGLSQSFHSESVAEAQLEANGFDAVEVRATPTLFNIFLWRVVAKDSEGNLRIGLYSSWARETPIDFIAVDRVYDPAIDAVLATDEGEIFEWFSQGYLGYEVENLEDHQTRVVLRDLRYGMVSNPAATPFSAQAIVAPDGTVKSIERMPREARDLKVSEELALMWRWIIRGRGPDSD